MISLVISLYSTKFILFLFNFKQAMKLFYKGEPEMSKTFNLEVALRNYLIEC